MLLVILYTLLGVACVILTLLWVTGKKKLTASSNEINRLHNEVSRISQELVENQKAEELLTQQLQGTAQLVQKLPYGLLTMDATGKILFANLCSLVFMQLTESEAIGQPLNQIVRLKYGESDRLSDLLKEVVSGNKHILFDNYRLLSGKKETTVSGSLIPVNNEGKSRMIMFFYDSTLESEKEADVKTFFSTAAHDLRTPISIIKSAISLLSENEDRLSVTQKKDLFKAVGSASVQLENLINDILNVSRIEQGRLDVKQEAFDMVSLVAGLIKQYEPLAQERKLFIKHDLSVLDLPKVAGDKQRSEEILANLISNALKYTFQGGITISHRQMDMNIITSVSDTGTGIAQENQSLLFKKFQQVGEARRQTTTKSTGLGLYVSQKMARLMRADLCLEKSEPGKGSTFSLVLPIAG